MTNEESMSNIMVEMGAIIESIQDILDGKEVSDFMMSFPIVREVWDLKHSAQVCTEPNQPVDLHKKIMNIPVDADNMQLAVEERNAHGRVKWNIFTSLPTVTSAVRRRRS